jgi:branched-subunit amino acid aminotransferase/4-amino-4-deoxychorismate lyase
MKQAGAEDVLFHYGGQIFETTRANFFIVDRGGTVITAGSGILGGITRSKVLEAARRHFPVEERGVGLSELKTAREAFITSSTKRVMPVVQVDDLTIGSGKPGETTLRLLALLKAEEEAYLTQIS